MPGKSTRRGAPPCTAREISYAIHIVSKPKDSTHPPFWRCAPPAILLKRGLSGGIFSVGIVAWVVRIAAVNPLLRRMAGVPKDEGRGVSVESRRMHGQNENCGK